MVRAREPTTIPDKHSVARGRGGRNKPTSPACSKFNQRLSQSSQLTRGCEAPGELLPPGAATKGFLPLEPWLLLNIPRGKSLTSSLKWKEVLLEKFVHQKQESKAAKPFSYI